VFDTRLICYHININTSGCPISNLTLGTCRFERWYCMWRIEISSQMSYPWLCFLSLFQVHILCIIVFFGSSKQAGEYRLIWWMLFPYILVPKPGKEVQWDPELWSALFNLLGVREWMCGLYTAGRKHAVYEHAWRSVTWRDIDAIEHFWRSAVGNTVACTTANPYRRSSTGRQTMSLTCALLHPIRFLRSYRRSSYCAH